MNDEFAEKTTKNEKTRIEEKETILTIQQQGREYDIDIVQEKSQIQLDQNLLDQVIMETSVKEGYSNQHTPMTDNIKNKDLADNSSVIFMNLKNEDHAKKDALVKKGEGEQPVDQKSVEQN